MESFLSNPKPKNTLQKVIKLDFPLKILYENRYCNQDDFRILVCGGSKKLNRNFENVFKVNGSKLEYKHYALNVRYDCKAVITNSELFIFGGYLINDKYDTSIRKFCIKNKTWSCKTQLYLNDNKFCLCSFKKNLYVVNGTSFFLYNSKNDQRTQKAKMHQTRYYAACTVF